MAAFWALLGCSPVLVWPFFILSVGSHSFYKGEALTAMSAFISAMLIGALAVFNVPELCDPHALDFAHMFTTLGFYSLVIPIVALIIKFFVMYPDPSKIVALSWIVVFIEFCVSCWKILA
jgi:hypothetical protein